MPGSTTSTSESKVGIDLRQLSSIRPLAHAYAARFETVAPLYAGDPGSTDAWRAAIARATHHHRRPTDLAAIISAQQARRGAGAETRAAAEALASPGTVAIVTGQQAGAFGGPLYTLLKAITTIQLAVRVSAEHQTQVVPVFWVEADDHDWGEVRSTTVLDAEGQPRRVSLPDPAGAGTRPVGTLTFDDSIGAALEQLRATLPQTEFTPWLMDLLGGGYVPGTTPAAATARLIEQLLGPLGLVVFDSSDPAAKSLAAEIFARELQFPGRTSSLALEAAGAMRAAGHEPQVLPQPGAVALFYVGDERSAIRRDDGGFTAGSRRFAAAELVAEAVDHPERFSPNVLLRPVVQDALFPTICYVAGPSELAYLGQLRGVYEHFGVPMPLVHQRATATLLDSASARFLAKYDLPLEDLAVRDESALNRLLQAQLPKDVEVALDDASTQIAALMTRVIEVIPGVDPTLAGAAKTTLGRMEHDLKTLHGKVIQAAKKRDETLRRQFVRAQAQIYPGGEPQERSLGVAAFLNRYGPALADRLLQELPLETGRHWLLTI